MGGKPYLGELSCSAVESLRNWSSSSLSALVAFLFFGQSGMRGGNWPRGPP